MLYRAFIYRARFLHGSLTMPVVGVDDRVTKEKSLSSAPNDEGRKETIRGSLYLFVR